MHAPKSRRTTKALPSTIRTFTPFYTAGQFTQEDYSERVASMDLDSALPPPPPPSLADSISTLSSLLPLLSSTRSSLPSLLRTFSPSTAHPSTGTALTPNPDVYRLRSSLVTKHIHDLREALDSPAIAEALRRAEQSENANGLTGVVEAKIEEDVKKRTEDAEREGWERLKALLGDLGRGAKEEEVMVADEDTDLEWDSVVDSATLKALVDVWQKRNSSRITSAIVEGVSGTTGMITLTVRGLMRCHLMYLFPAPSDGLVMERITCFSLKEDKRSYQPSQYGLMQEITRTGMEVIGKKEGSLRATLAFVKKPPVPF